MSNETCYLSQNTRAINMLDLGEIDAAKTLFYKNYIKSKSPLTFINLACFLSDEHYVIYKNSIYNSLTYHFRTNKAKTILKKCMKSFALEETEKYHLLCLLGSIEADQRHYDSAIDCYSDAIKLEKASIEALSMLAWLFTLRHRYIDADACLQKLAEALKLGSDIEENLETIFEKCPFARFPYYQLAVYVLSFIRPNKANDLLETMINTKDDHHDLLFPAEELIILCLYLKQFSELDKLISCLLPDIQKDSDYINATLRLIKKIDNDLSDFKKHKKELSKYVSKKSQYVYASRRKKWKNDFDYLLQAHFHTSYKECHFLNCPIHHETACPDD